MNAERPGLDTNVRWLVAGNLVVKPAWFLFLLVSTRLLGAAEFGRTMLALASVAVLQVIFEFGIDQHVVRRLSANREDYHRLLSHSLVMKLVSGAALGVAVLLLSLVPGAMPVEPALLIPAILFGFFNSIMVHARMVFRAHEQLKFEAISIVLEKVLVIAFVAAALAVAPTAANFLTAYAAAYLVTALITAEMARRRYGRPSAAFEPAYLWRDVLKAGLPFAMMNLFSIVYFRSGSLLLSWLTRSDAMVGYYNAGYRLVESFMLFPTVLTTPLYPVLARRWPEGNALSPVLLRTVRLVLAGSILIVFPIVTWRVEVTRLLFGEEFLPAAVAVGIISLAMLPVGMNFVFGSLVAASGRQNRGNVLILGVTVVNVLLNLLLIPRHGLAGAAAVTVGTELLLAIGNWWITREFVDIRRLAMLGSRAVLAVTVVGVAAWFLRGLPFPWGTATSVVLLALALLALGVIRPEDRFLVTGGAARGGVPPPGGDGSR